MVAAMIWQSTDLNVTDLDGTTPLHLGVGNHGVAGLFLEVGIFIEQKRSCVPVSRRVIFVAHMQRSRFYTRCEDFVSIGFTC